MVLIMRKIRTHFSIVDCNQCCPDGGESLTEQSHAESLNIRKMMTSGYIQTNKTAMWGDFSEIPPLDVLLNNRIKLTNIYNALPKKVKQNVETIDEFARALLRGDEQELLDYGIIERIKQELEEPNPAPTAE